MHIGEVGRQTGERCECSWSTSLSLELHKRTCGAQATPAVQAGAGWGFRKSWPGVAVEQRPDTARTQHWPNDSIIWWARNGFHSPDSLKVRLGSCRRQVTTTGLKGTAQTTTCCSTETHRGVVGTNPYSALRSRSARVSGRASALCWECQAQHGAPPAAARGSPTYLLTTAVVFVRLSPCARHARTPTCPARPRPPPTGRNTHCTLQSHAATAPLARLPWLAAPGGGEHEQR